jgi:hypothetical protein
MYDPAVSIKFREAKKFLKFKISWLMPLIIFINGQFLEKLCIGNWACVFDDSVSGQSTGWRYTVTHIGRPPTNVRCALCSCPQGAHCACILLCIEIPKPTNVQLVAKHFVVRRIWRWVKLKKKNASCVWCFAHCYLLCDHVGYWYLSPQSYRQLLCYDLFSSWSRRGTTSCKSSFSVV